MRFVDLWKLRFAPHKPDPFSLTGIHPSPRVNFTIFLDQNLGLPSVLVISCLFNSDVAVAIFVKYGKLRELPGHLFRVVENSTCLLVPTNSLVPEFEFASVRNKCHLLLLLSLHGELIHSFRSCIVALFDVNHQAGLVNLPLLRPIRIWNALSFLFRGQFF